MKEVMAKCTQRFKYYHHYQLAVIRVISDGWGMSGLRQLTIANNTPPEIT